MQVSGFLVHLAGAVMLLLYSTRMVRTGIERAAGPLLRTLFISLGKGWVKSVLAGVIGAIFLQSATAIALLVSSFAATGVLSVAVALAIVLGADLGTALVVQFLSLDLNWLMPALLAIGGFMFLKMDTRLAKQLGRVIIGVGLILISLSMIGTASAPLRSASWMPGFIGFLSEDILISFFGGVLLAFLFHSSVAAVLLFATLAAKGILPIEAGLPLVLGANAGGGLVAVWLSRDGKTPGRHVTGSNLLFRLVGGMAMLAVMSGVDLPLERLGATADRQLVNFHLLFNAALVLVCLPFIRPALALMRGLIRDEQEELDLLKPASALDTAVLKMPHLALASVTRELLRMSEIVEVMVTPVMDFFSVSNPQQVQRVRQLDKDVNRAHTDIKLYIAQLSQGELSSEEAQRAVEMTSVAISLERVGDIISKELLPLTIEKHRRNLEFSAAGWKELTNFHARVITNMQLALNVLVSEDLETARMLVEEKAVMRRLERESHDKHMARLSSGTVESRASSDIHLETIRALKEINSRFATFAYPTLEKRGVLLDSRLS
uniref:Na/Pi cotransporter family protein n=1 Tax=Pararhizobium sp. IMCC3301 TaxID=3067904 RepID=UPI002741A5EF|nr:Na/Pi cotransporter family protein [Pararhizobium sp. IMCC3301]